MLKMKNSKTSISFEKAINISKHSNNVLKVIIPEKVKLTNIKNGGK